MKGQYLFLKGEFHSFVDEIGRFTKTSGFHYDVYLHPPRIVHHRGYWEVKPSYMPGVFVVNDAIHISRKYVEDEKGRYDGIKVPGDVYKAKELYDKIIEAVLKYVLARFFFISAGSGKWTIRVSFKEGMQISTAPMKEGLRLLNCCNDFLEDIAKNKYVVTLHPPRIFSSKDPLWGWIIQPHEFYRSLVLDRKYVLYSEWIERISEQGTNERYDGFHSFLYNEMYYPASAVYDAVISAIARYALRRFLGIKRSRSLELNVTVSFASTH